jgi:hypothetical protein
MSKKGSPGPKTTEKPAGMSKPPSGSKAGGKPAGGGGRGGTC